MRARGIQRLGDERTPEDHIGLMLALLSLKAGHETPLAIEARQVYRQLAFLLHTEHRRPSQASKAAVEGVIGRLGEPFQVMRDAR